MKHIKFFLLFSFVILLGLAACSSAKDETTSIQLGEVTRSLFYAPQYVALEKGFFEEEGLNVELQTTWGGDKTMTALLSDGIDIALVGSETSMYVYAQESKDYAVNFAQLTQTDGTFLVAKEPYPNFNWDDLIGRKFLGQRKGGMPQMVGEFVLKKNGIDPHADLELSQNIEFANIPSAFVSGDYEFVQLFEPTASMMEKEGVGYTIASFGEESGRLPYTVFMAKKSFLDEKRDVAVKFTRAIYKAQQWVQENDPQTIAELLQPYFEDTELDMLTSSIERYKNQDSFATDPILDEEEWNNLKDIMAEAGELPDHDIPYSELVDTEIAKEVMGES